MKTNGRKYGKCEVCSGPVLEKTVTVDLRLSGQLYVFENVPVGVCQECGERVFKGPVLEQLERLAGRKSAQRKTIRVAVAEYASV